MNLAKNVGKKILGIFGKMCPNVNGKLLFLMRTHEWPNLKDPKTFNEKTTWLKLNKYNSDALVAECADKYLVRKYVEEKGCGENLNELYGVYDNFDDIDFEKLPNQFALKCTHGCAYNIIIDDKEKFDKNSARKKVNRWMKEKYGYATSELHYTKIKPRIIIERYLCDKNSKMPIDYKFYCMNGKVESILVCSERDKKLKLSYYDREWRRLPYEKKKWSSKKNIEKPKNLKKMIEYSEKLSKDFPFVRVDLYNDDGKIVFGELTFTPACGCAPYYSEVGDRKLGNILDFGSPNLQTLLSVVGDVDLKKLTDQMKLYGNYVIVNQTSSISGREDNKEVLHRLIKVNDIGLSRSRNLAMANCVSDVALFSDDDMVYDDCYVKVIQNAYKKYPDAAAIVFYVEHSDKKFEKKPFKEGRIGIIKSLRISSVQLTINIRKILDSDISFDESFGSGARFAMGEENILLADILRKGLKIYYVPDKIGILMVKHDSSWFCGYDEQYFISRGASYFRMSPRFWRILVLQFALRKGKVYGGEISFFQVLKAMNDGAKQYREGHRDD